MNIMKNSKKKIEKHGKIMEKPWKNHGKTKKN